MFLVHFDYSHTYFMIFLAIFSCWCLLKQVKKIIKKYIFNAFANNACVIILLEEEEEEEKEKKSPSHKGAKLQIMQDWGGQEQDYYLRSFWCKFMDPCS